jgi:class 3 adenylate cyclase
MCKVYYEKKGKGDAVVLLHADLQNSSMWQEQVKDLSQTSFSYYH